MTPFVAEILGTFTLMIFGIGVNANNSLSDTYAKGTGWILITIGWGLGVFCGVIVAGPVSGAHINPAVTLGLAVAGQFEWSQVPMFILAQFIGAMLAAVCAWLLYYNHYNKTEDPGTILGTFSTGPAIKSTGSNLFSEIIGTFMLILVVLYIVGAKITGPGTEEIKVGLGSIGALPVALLVVAIGMCLGGTTGYAINPARDLGPRIVHALVPIKHKGSSNWQYSWVPVIGPLMGAALAAVLYTYLTAAT